MLRNFSLYIKLTCNSHLKIKYFASLQIATLLSAVATWEFARIQAIGWKWCGVVWIYNILIYMLLDPVKIFVRYALSGRAWSLVLNKRVSEYEPSIS